MSRTTVILAAVLGCVLLFAFWVLGGDEAIPIPETSNVSARRLSDSKPSFPKPQRPRSLLDQSKATGDAERQIPPEQEQTDGDAEVVMKDRLDDRPGTVEGRRAFNKGRREARREARRSQRQEPPPHAGVVPQGQLSRRDTEPQEMRKSEQPPLRQPVPADKEIDEDSLDHLRDLALGDPDPEERMDAISQIDLDEPGAMDVMIKALNDSDSEVRLAALDEIWTNSDEPPVDILASVINDPDPEVRLEAVRMLSESEEPYALELLRRALADTDEDVRDEAATALDVDL